MAPARSKTLAEGARVITVQQPWATLLALGEKPIEYRSWPTSYRGPLAISRASLSLNIGVKIARLLG